jgi:Amidohydrolase
MSIADFIGMMDRSGVKIGVLRAGNAIMTDILAQYPNRFIGLASISPHDGMPGVRELVRLVRECGFSALRVSVLYNMVPASDRRYYPLYAKRVDIPIRIYTNMNYATGRPVRSRPSSAPRSDSDGFPGVAHRRWSERLALGERDGCFTAASPEPLLRYRLAPRSVLSWAESDEDPSIVFGAHRSQAARRGGLNLKRVPAMPTAIKLVVCGSHGERAFAARHASVAFVGPCVPEPDSCRQLHGQLRVDACCSILLKQMAAYGAEEPKTWPRRFSRSCPRADSRQRYRSASGRAL